MQMTAAKLILFRAALLAVGRWGWGSRLIRRLLLRQVKRPGTITYVAHADFLDVRDLCRDGQAEAPLPPLFRP